jgi:fibronectin type 3 domain-containing protein
MRPTFPALVAFVACALLSAHPAQSLPSDDQTSNYQWKLVRIGAGGFVVGMVLHPLDATVRYLRTDVGNAYRWDVSSQQWIPMRVANADGSGILSPAAISAPSGYGIESIAVDPNNKSIVYMVFPTVTSCDIQCPTNLLEIYRSTDGGQNFTPGNMTAAAITGSPNGPHRALGERLAVDPANSSVLYFASESQGIYRSVDGGTTWTQFTGTSAPPSNIEFLNIQFAKAPGTATVNGILLSKTIFAVSINNSDAGGDVYQTQDGGQTWTDISTGITDSASGQSLTLEASESSIDSTDALYVAENASTDGYHRAYWKYASGKWSRVSLEGFISQPLVNVAPDPIVPQRIYAIGYDTGLSRSDDGGVTWISLGAPLYANIFGWLPQTIGMQSGEWHSNGGLYLDNAGNLWAPTGQEGAITIASAAAASATAAAPPKWTIQSTGVEELVSQDIVIPSGSNDTIIAMAADTTGFVISNPDNFSAVQIPLQQEIISQGTSVDYAPDAPTYIAVTSSNVATNGPNYSGYSLNGGQSWTRFGPALTYTCGTTQCDTQAGIIAVSPRAARALGSDHIVIYPPSGLAPQYSQDGGATWHVTTSFPLNADGMTINPANYNSFLYPQIHQHLLRADPFVADKFYLKFTHAPQMLYISTDGGKTWQGQTSAGLPDWAWAGQLVVDSKLKNDLWYADGWEGSASHGVFHSLDGGQTFQQIAGISHAVTIAVGAGSGQAADAAYAVYCYCLLTSDAKWGIFRSTNAGSSWDRVSYYPAGIYDRPDTMAASQDTFGKVYLGFSGNSFVYGQLIATGPTLPGAPSGLSAATVSDSAIGLTWSAASGTVSSYSVFRGTSAGAESATAIATGITGTTYQDTSVVKGTTYYYKVAAVSSAGAGPLSNEVSAEALTPAISIAVASGSSASATVSAGQTATYNLSLSPTNYTGTISFTCSGAPAGATCVVPSPLTVTTGSSATPFQVTVRTSSAAATAPNHSTSALLTLAATLLFISIARIRRFRLSATMAIVAVAFLIAANGCGSSNGGGGGSGPNPVTSTLTISATAPGLSTATQQLTLTVQ